MIGTLHVFPLVDLEHTESSGYRVRKGLIVNFNFQARSCLSTAVLRAAVNLSEFGHELYMLKLEHSDTAGDGE